MSPSFALINSEPFSASPDTAANLPVQPLPGSTASGAGNQMMNTDRKEINSNAQFEDWERFEHSFSLRQH